MGVLQSKQAEMLLQDCRKKSKHSIFNQKKNPFYSQWFHMTKLFSFIESCYIYSQNYKNIDLKNQLLTA